jgi:ATP-dependent DNA helicase RecQ
MADLKKILLRYWGFSSFRPMQEEIIGSVMEGKDTLALLPTGGGKSICFQVPALAKEGLCLVITPLISLMKDQVEHLVKKGIKAIAVHSGMHRNEIELALGNCAYGDVKFLYLSPERLETEQFRAIVQKMKVCLVAVDEAHCISQWGYDFRPPYLKIIEIRKYLPGIPLLALTATATPEVVVDIQVKLGFREENVFRKSFERKNLTYVVIREEDKFGRLLRILSKLPGCGIIYVRNRRKTREIAEFLEKNRVSADYYHAGLDARTRDRKQEAWMKGEKTIMVATNAFGMGIDKPDVRLVVHMDLTDSLEAYFQEAGRAGRDEKRAYAILLYENADLIAAKHNLAKAFPAPETIRSIYQALGNYFQLATGSGKDESFEFDIDEFSRNYKFNPVIVYNALKFLEKDGYLLLDEYFGSPSRIHFETSRETLYRFQVENKKFDPFIKLLLRSYSGIFNEFVNIGETEIASRSGIPLKDVEDMLGRLQHYRIITYIKQSARPQIRYTEERLDPKNLVLSDENYKERKKTLLRKMQSVIDYAAPGDTCRSRQLLAYFGEKDSKRCGKCDVCINRNKMGLNDLEFGRIHDQLEELLHKGPATLPELIFGIKDSNEEKVIKVIRWLEDNGILMRDEKQRYSFRMQADLGF